jgi:hypothetical protein
VKDENQAELIDRCRLSLPFGRTEVLEHGGDDLLVDCLFGREEFVEPARFDLFEWRCGDIHVRVEGCFASRQRVSSGSCVIAVLRWAAFAERSLSRVILVQESERRNEGHNVAQLGDVH